MLDGGCGGRRRRGGSGDAVTGRRRARAVRRIDRPRARRAHLPRADLAEPARLPRHRLPARLDRVHPRRRPLALRRSAPSSRASRGSSRSAFGARYLGRWLNSPRSWRVLDADHRGRHDRARHQPRHARCFVGDVTRRSVAARSSTICTTTSSGSGSSGWKRIVPLSSENPASSRGDRRDDIRAERVDADVRLRAHHRDQRLAAVHERRHPVALALLGIRHHRLARRRRRARWRRGRPGRGPRGSRRWFPCRHPGTGPSPAHPAGGTMEG